MALFRNNFIPNQRVPNSWNKGNAVFWALVLLMAWQFWPSDLAPRPLDVLGAFSNLWFNEGLGEQLIISYSVQLKAMAFATVISLLLSYSATIPFIRPLVIFISTWRFVSLGPLVIFITLLITADGHELKVLLLFFGIAVFYITSMVQVVLDIPTEELEHARTLKMNEWHTVWEVAVIGKLDAALEMLRQNAAMGWMMLTMVEGLVRSEGGIGTLMLNQLKHFHLAEVAAIITILFTVGFVQDLVLRLIRKVFLPHADLAKERR